MSASRKLVYWSPLPKAVANTRFYFWGGVPQKREMESMKEGKSKGEKHQLRKGSEISHMYNAHDLPIVLLQMSLKGESSAVLAI